MKFRVEISPGAVEDAIDVWRFIALDSPEAADRWYNGLMDAIDSPALHSRRCRRARESDEFEREVRQLNFNSHRVLFTIEGRNVNIHHIRHAARRNL